MLRRGNDSRYHLLVAISLLFILNEPDLQ
ncbi:unnamed protein product [Larinioides sclopetarius]|uniref:Uncharacterized protein n=1 Tax=Larinioides sclopetarius TaxID=280406 RepID=A0AAV1ZEG0_9ARAC